MDNVRRHPDEGARLIGPLAAWLGEWAGAVPHHHERFDGRGYPRGLAGDRISLAGRIVAVADSYEVMTAMRPYSKPIGVTAARQELVKCSGAQFDPVVVRAFLNISVGRLWRVVGMGSWIAQLPVIGWVDRLGWNWGAAIMSGTTAIALTAPNIVPRPAPVPTPTTGISVVSTNGIPGAVGGSTSGPGGPSASTGGSPPAPTTPGQTTSGQTGSGQTTSTTPGAGPTGTNGSANPGGGAGATPVPVTSPPAATPTPAPPSSPPSPTPSATPAPTPPPDEPPVVTVKGGLALLGNFNGSGTFTDADLAGHTFTATVNYGDGTATTTLKLTGATFKLKHTYNALLASCTITVTITDNDGVSGFGTATVTIV